jgi:hypothetical protein
MSNERMFDRSSYSQRTISTFQLVGAYLVDIYYNHLYTEAVKLKNDGKVPNITEGYRHATFAFVSAIDPKSKTTYRAEHYTKLLQGINEYFIHWTSFNTLTITECIDKIVREFVPDDYYRSLDKDQKRNILRAVLISSIRSFTKSVATEFLSSIMDNHDDPANTEALKEKIIEIFIHEREGMFHKFLDCRSGGNLEEKIDKSIADKMRNEIKRLNDERDKLVAVCDKLAKESEIRTDQLTKVVAKYRKMEQSYKSILAEYRISREKIDELERQVSYVEPRSMLLDDEDESLKKTIDVKAVTSKPSIIRSNPSHPQTSQVVNEDESSESDEDIATMDAKLVAHTVSSKPIGNPASQQTPQVSQTTNITKTVDKVNTGKKVIPVKTIKKQVTSLAVPIPSNDYSEEDDDDSTISDDAIVTSKLADAAKLVESAKSKDNKPKTDLGVASKLSEIF